MAQRLTDIALLKNSLVELTHKLKEEVDPLVGLQYMIFLNDNEKFPVFCTLCRKNDDDLSQSFKKGVLRTMIQHFKARTHRMHFLKKHFPTVHESLTTLFSIKGIDDANFERLLRRICSMIEDRYGRKNPVSISSAQYEMNKEKILQELFDESHVKEKPQSPLLIDLLLVINRFDNRHSTHNR
jgi:hypothetical protein